MDSNIRYVSKDELHKMIDEIPDDEFMVLTYKKNVGISDTGKKIKKKKTKILIDRATILVLTDSKPIRKVDLEGDFSLLPIFNKGNIVKSILFPKLE